MSVDERQEIVVQEDQDVVRVRQAARRWASMVSLSLVETTKLITAASELARNTFEHGGGGRVSFEGVRREDGRRGVRAVFQDQGPGIPDIARALSDGFTTGRGLGLGLGGSKRLVSEFMIESEVGRGTKVVITTWKA
jgi:serine/threonine-protein kinase RsbT